MSIVQKGIKLSLFVKNECIPRENNVSAENSTLLTNE